MAEQAGIFSKCILAHYMLIFFLKHYGKKNTKQKKNLDIDHLKEIHIF